MKFGVVVFPGSNCDQDCFNVVKDVLKQPVEYIWHHDAKLDHFGCIILPGGFSYGDYLRCGAIARFSPIMANIKKFADRGGLVIGICNGFQILTEAGLLPGALQKNTGLRFLCDVVEVRVVSTRSALTGSAERGAVLRIPINHFEGNYTCDAVTLERLRADDRVVMRYVDNPNGSLDDIAGICNEAGNVVGLMPHPERASEAILGSADGVVLLRSLLDAATEGVRLPG